MEQYRQWLVESIEKFEKILTNADLPWEDHDYYQGMLRQARTSLERWDKLATILDGESAPAV